MGKLTFGATGLSYQVDKVNLSYGASPDCPRCGQRVYFNEEKRAIGKVWHTRCFTCAKCKKGLDSTNCNGHEGEVYCTACHRREFGPKGYGFAGGAAGLSTESSVKKFRAVDNLKTQAVPAQIPAQKIDHTSPNCCPRCGKNVYFAEEILALKRKWHRLCFKCCECNKSLQPGMCNEHENSLYCSSCYGRKFGPKGYGFAGGAGTLLSSEQNKPYQNGHRHTNGTPTNDENQKQGPVNGNGEWTEAVYI